MSGDGSVSTAVLGLSGHDKQRRMNRKCRAGRGHECHDNRQTNHKLE